MTEQLDKLLRSPKLSEELRQGWTWFSTAREQWAADSEKNEKWWTREALRRGRILLLEWMRGVFHKHMLSLLERPHIVSWPDVREAAWRCLGQADDFQAGYDRFVHQVTSLVDANCRSAPFAVTTGYYCWYSRPDAVTHDIVWSNDSGFRIILMGAIPLSEEDNWGDWQEVPEPVVAPRVIYAVVEGNCSRKALSQFRRSARRVLRSVLESLRVIKEQESQPSLFPAPVWINFGRSGKVGPFAYDAGPSDSWPLQPLLDAYYSNPTKKDSMDRRLRNALHLLVEADHQRHDAVRLALCVAAMEALACEGTENISTTLAENVATLLEPKGEARPDAVAFVKKLYDARSKTLHGEKLEHEEKMREHARVVAAALMKAILERREFQRKAGFDPETPQELLGELKKSKFTPGETPGVTPSPVRKLWSSGA
ncbi:MAG: hypothetical protein HY000_36805 [Planctomycetes bacterium]|nr:hypothetical protein [Planctomycetota bacterium]